MAVVAESFRELLSSRCGQASMEDGDGKPCTVALLELFSVSLACMLTGSCKDALRRCDRVLARQVCLGAGEEVLVALVRKEVDAACHQEEHSSSASSSSRCSQVEAVFLKLEVRSPGGVSQEWASELSPRPSSSCSSWCWSPIGQAFELGSQAIANPLGIFVLNQDTSRAVFFSDGRQLGAQYFALPDSLLQTLHSRGSMCYVSGKVLLTGGLDKHEGAAVKKCSWIRTPIPSGDDRQLPFHPCLSLQAQPMGTARHSHACTVMGGKVVVVGGFAGIGALASVEIYDPKTDAWRDLPEMRQGRAKCGVVALGSMLLVFAGEGNSGEALGSCEAWTAASGWQPLAEFKGAAGGACSAAVVNCTIYVAFHAAHRTDDTVLWIYDLARDCWSYSVHTALPRQIQHLCSAPGACWT